jgi:DMSO/TMAO reductase YedYZ heme-binding membrane subunit
MHQFAYLLLVLSAVSAVIGGWANKIWAVVAAILLAIVAILFIAGVKP